MATHNYTAALANFYWEQAQQDHKWAVDLLAVEEADGIDGGAGAAGDQGEQADHGVAGAAVAAPAPAGATGRGRFGHRNTLDGDQTPLLLYTALR